MQEPELQTLIVGTDARQIRYEQISATSNTDTPGLFWLGGYMSDMAGSKAEALAQFAKATGRANMRFDYSGHGTSSGAFTDGTISRWLEEAEAIFALTSGPQIIIGSSMGGWLGQLLALRQPERVHALVLIAPATDMTQDLMWDEFDEEARATLLDTGVFHQPSDYGEPYPITRGLIEDGRKHLLFGGPIEITAPVYILQGRKDADVPWQHAARLLEAMPYALTHFTLVPEGDHRLSTPENLALLCQTVKAASEE